MADRKIVSGVRKGGRLFRPDSAQDVEDLDKMLTPDEVKNLKKQGVLEGDFKGTKDAEVNIASTGTGPARPQGGRRTDTASKAEVKKADEEATEPATEPPPAGSSGAPTPWAKS